MSSMQRYGLRRVPLVRHLGFDHEMAPCRHRQLEAVGAAIRACAAVLPSSRERAKARRTLILAHAELRERELLKFTSLVSAVAGALRQRGVAEPAASLTAETGIAVFKVAFDRWVDDPRPRDLLHHIEEGLDEIKTVIAGASRPSTTTRTGKPSRTRSSRSTR
jgi:hypothetical protein